MSLSTKYNPAEVEDKWYRYWQDQRFFHATPNPDKEPYCIVIPPPNVTGVLHMGHMLNNTIQDILIRKARMEGKEACWVPGTDHASIATEAKVVAMLRERGIKKSDLTRDEFLKYAWEWKEKYGGIILEQLKKLGASCDWDRTSFTMDPEYYRAVIRVFVDLYNKGYIYRGLRMINWDCEAKTALSNEEVLYKEDGEKSILYSVRYQVQGQSDQWVTIATQRPETIMGDVAIAVNPTDARYQNLIGRKVLVPFINRPIPVIADDYVDKTFGTGCLKVTPAHDVNDYEIGLRHQLPVIDTINDDGTLNDKCEIAAYTGKDRFVVRKMIIKDLREAGHLVKEDEFITRIGRSERTNTVVEPKLSLQWFVKMKEISQRALRAVEEDEIHLHPSKFKNTYRHWMENVRDWCISRQLWWGHRIPAYYYGTGENDFVVAETIEEAVVLASKKSGRAISGSQLQQDSDVLDTWASSWLWPTAVFDGFNDQYFDKKTGKIIVEKNKDLDYFYPTQVLVTAPEILFFWVARMIIAGYEYMDRKPFEDVYLTGIVRDKLGRKMSKSLGNSPDPLELISRFGADGVRTGMLFSSPAGNDLPFDEKLCEQGRNFSNKIWNAFRLVKGWETTHQPAPAENIIAADWFEARFQQALSELNDHFSKFRISDALMTVYKLVWDDFCAWYLEMIKPEFGKPIDQETYQRTVHHFEQVLKVLHPFMPFITEELWQALKDRSAKEAIVLASWPAKAPAQTALLAQAALSFSVVSEVRNLRNAKGISPKEPLALQTKAGKDLIHPSFVAVTRKLANLSEIRFDTASGGQGAGFLVGTHEFFVPLAGKADAAKEKESIQKELDYLRGFLASVDKKLSNERFVNSAPPAVIDGERKKKADAESKIKSLEDNLKALG
ncbi:MAG: valine--tRNA ligase [Cyclobacteriaceae bacterium]|nr:valine--tRNA ligase [Cytophagales bacterium]HNP77471.1 valine--tRNA ligase [Cyclobacteriaceae bacterium]